MGSLNIDQTYFSTFSTCLYGFVWEKTNKKSFANFHFQAKALLGFIKGGVTSIVVGSFGVRADVPGGIWVVKGKGPKAQPMA